jgi:23S rRNA (adenine2503-C2)-methyltransferase
VTASLEYPAYRGEQLYHWVYAKRASSIDEMSTLPRRLREALGGEIGIKSPIRRDTASDGTSKYLFPTRHGGYVEAALIPDRDRLTLCLSTQVGCRRGCSFCQTARQGFQGNLSAGEILNQFHALPERDDVTNIVYMGMGEPLDNIDATLASLSILTDPDGYALGRGRITVSTVGIHPALELFLDESRVNLAVSLHTPFPEERRRIMPVENANPILDTVDLIRRRREDRSRKVSFEYTMFAGINDTPRHVAGIARVLNGLSVRVNLIPFHEIPGTDLRPSSSEAIEEFRDALREKGIPTFVRSSRGQDINAACGLLWTRYTESGDRDAG